MLHKNFELLETKADGDSGEFTAIVSTFGNVDRVGDRIMPGAWTKTLAHWAKSGDPIPIILAHQWDDPFAHIGIARPEDVKQVTKGLQVKGKLDVEDNPVAKQVHRLMQRRSLKEFSIGYDVPAGGEKRAADGANEISEITLAECGPCLKGIDPKTELQAVKSALGVKDAPDAAAQREEAARVVREVEQAQIPEVPEQPAPPVEPEIDLAHELQEVKGLLAEVREELDALKEKADATDKESRKARSVDPLRERADAVALEIASDGQSLRRPPKTAAPTPPDLIPLDELKERTRDEMLGVLSGGITE
jgi:HK97 family phage prohead protease